MFKLSSVVRLSLSLLATVSLSNFPTTPAHAEQPDPIIQVEADRNYERPYFFNSFWDMRELYRFTLLAPNKAIFRVERDEYDFNDYPATYDAAKLKITVPNATCNNFEVRPCTIVAYLRDINGVKSFKTIQFNITSTYGTFSDRWSFDSANQIIASDYSDSWGNLYSLTIKRVLYRGVSRIVQERADSLEPGDQRAEARIYTIRDTSGTALESLSVVRKTWLDINTVDSWMSLTPLTKIDNASVNYYMKITSQYFDSFFLYGVMKRDILNGPDTTRTQRYYQTELDEDGYPHQRPLLTVYSEKSPQNTWVERLWTDDEQDDNYIVIGKPDPLVAQGAVDAPDKRIWPQEVLVPFPSDSTYYSVGFVPRNGHYFLEFGPRNRPETVYRVNYPSTDILEIGSHKFKIAISDRGYVTLTRL